MKSSVQFNVSCITIILWTQCWEKKYGTFWMQIVHYVTGIIFQLLKQNCIIVIISILFLGFALSFVWVHADLHSLHKWLVLISTAAICFMTADSCVLKSGTFLKRDHPHDECGVALTGLCHFKLQVEDYINAAHIKILCLRENKYTTVNTRLVPFFQTF